LIGGGRRGWGVLREIGDESWLDVIHDKPWGSEDHLRIGCSLCMRFSVKCVPQDGKAGQIHKSTKISVCCSCLLKIT